MHSVAYWACACDLYIVIGLSRIIIIYWNYFLSKIDLRHSSVERGFPGTPPRFASAMCLRKVIVLLAQFGL
jgi:hypothetical protein